MASSGSSSGTGGPVLVARLDPAVGPVQAMAVDSTYVYWGVNTRGFNGLIMAAPVAGGEVVTFASGIECLAPQGLASDGTNVYWTSLGGGGVLMKAPAAGGAATTLVSGEWPYQVAVAGNSVYWGDLGYPADRPPPRVPPASTVEKTAVSGQETTTLATVPDFDGGIIVWTLAADNRNVYWTTGWGWAGDKGPSTLMQVSADGGVPALLASSDAGFGASLAVDSTSVYWTERIPGAGSTELALMRVPIGGGAPVTVASGLGSWAFAIVGETAYYAAGASADVISAVPVDGGSATVLATVDGEVWNWLLGNGRSLFWMALKNRQEFGIYRLDLK